MDCRRLPEAQSAGALLTGLRGYRIERVHDFDKLARCGLGIEGAADGSGAEARFICYLRRHALVAASARNMDSWSGFLGGPPRLQQFGIAPDMLVSLLFRQVEAVQVLGNPWLTPHPRIIRPVHLH